MPKRRECRVKGIDIFRKRMPVRFALILRDSAAKPKTDGSHDEEDEMNSCHKESSQGVLCQSMGWGRRLRVRWRNFETIF